jgi:hypothetical protein
VTATSAPWAGITDAPLTTASPDLILEPPSVGGVLSIRQPAGVAGVDDLDLWHDGTDARILSMSGVLLLYTAGTAQKLKITQSGGGFASLETESGNQFRISGNNFYPERDGEGIAYYSGDETELWLWAGSAERMRLTAGYVSAMGCKFFGKLSTAPTGAVCDNYFDTDLAMFCIHDGAGFVQADDYTTACE